MKKRSILLPLLCGMTLTAAGQTLTPQQSDLLRAGELNAVGCHVGTIETLLPPLVQGEEIPFLDEEALYLNAISRAEIGSPTAETTLLRFITEHPHSAYLPYAQYKLGEHYYISQNYTSAAYWLRKYSADLLPDRLAETSDYMLATAYMKDGRDDEAIKVFRPLTLSAHYHDDATFYTGYLLMKHGRVGESRPFLEKLSKHETYGAYALAYLADSYLGEMKYNDVLRYARQALAVPGVSDEVLFSASRSAGLAASNMGLKKDAITYLTTYVTGMGAKAGRVESLTLGKELFETGDYRRSIDFLRSTSGTYQDFMAQLALYYEGLAQLSLKNLDEGSKALSRAKELNVYPQITEAAFFDWALALYSKTPGRLGEGTTQLVSFMNKYPQSEYASRAAGYIRDAALNDGDAAQALATIDRLSHKPSLLVKTRSEVALRQANSQLKSGNAEEASRSYDAIIKANEDPESVAQALFWKGELAYRNGDYQGTINATTRALQVQPDGMAIDPQAYYNLGYAYYSLSQWGKARQAFDKYLSIVPSSAVDQRTGALCRLGDIEVIARRYSDAIDFYQRAETIGGKDADYALFKRGMTIGLLKQYRDKASIMATVPQRFPASTYIPEALFERGQALSLAGDETSATASFKQVFENYPNSPVAPKSGTRLALSYFNAHQLDQASTVYETVIRKYPHTDEAKSALQDLKSISIELNRVDEYTRLAAQMGGGGTVTAHERDSLSYLAAEHVVAAGSPVEAEAALDKYLSEYPDGIFILKATYNKGYIRYQQKDYTGAIAILTPLTQRSLNDPSLTVDLYRLLAECYDQSAQPGRAAEAYLALARHLETVADRSDAVSQAIDRGRSSQSKAFVIRLAGDISHQSIAVDEPTQALAYGTAAEMCARDNDKEQALAFASLILSLPQNDMYARAKVIKALHLYDLGKYKESQTATKAVIDKGTTDTYWLARAFILLSDTYVKMGDKETAKTYLEGVKANYKNHGDGIITMINDRLQQLQ